MRHLLLLLVVTGALIGLGSPRAAEPPPAPEQIHLLVDRLGSDLYPEREEAGRELDALGAAALPALKAALQSSDAEVRRRARDLVERIELRVETARALTPKRVHFVCKDRPAAEAVAEFAKQTGQPIQLQGDLSRLASRRATLDTGETTFWEAFAKLCDAAGLVENDPPPAPAAPGVDTVFEVRRRRIIVEDGRLAAQQAPGPLVLEDRKASARPTGYAGALRIQALPRAADGSGDNPTALTLEVKVDPSVTWERLSCLRIDRVIDEHGQSLRQPAPYFGDTFPYESDQVVMMVDGSVVPPANAGQRQLPVLLRPGEKPAKSLRELTGTLSGWVQTAPEPLVTIQDVLKAADKTVEGPDGSRVTVTEVAHEKDGFYKLKVEVQSPPREFDPFVGNVQIIRRINRKVALEGIALARNDEQCPLSLFDAKGNLLKWTTAEYTPAAAKRTFTLVYPDVAAPVKLVYTGRRTTFIEAPFTFKDVPFQQGK
jgi:hypothetical protein